MGMNAAQIGQRGREPDVKVWDDDWTIIIDTKAYSAYDLPSDHQLRMQTSYVQRYDNVKVFGYIAGGFANTFNHKLRLIVEATGIPGFGISITNWTLLLSLWQGSNKTAEDLLELLRCNREIVAQDVADFYSTAPE